MKHILLISLAALAIAASDTPVNRVLLKENE